LGQAAQVINPDVIFLDKILRAALKEYIPNSGTMKVVLESAGEEGRICAFAWSDAENSVSFNFPSSRQAKEFVAQWSDSEIIFEDHEWMVHIVKIKF